MLAGLVMLTAVGCAGSAPSSPGAATQPSSPGAASGTGGVVSPPGGTSGSVPASSQAVGDSQRSGVTGGALFGGDVPLVSQQPKLGRKLAIVRIYDFMGEKFLLPKVKRYMAAGSTILVSLTTKPGQNSYASIAAGHEDAFISSWLQSVQQAAVHYHFGAIYVNFEVEADSQAHHAGLGTPAQFVQAWDHIHQLAVNAHLDWNQGGRLHWVFILTHFAYISGLANQYWPGPNEVDIVSADGYNAQGCRGAGGSQFTAQSTAVLTPTALFGATLRFASSHGGLPVFIAEWGSVPYSSPSVEVGFINQMAQFVASHRQIAGAEYWNGHAPGTACDYSLNSHASALAALAVMGHSAALQGHVVPAH